MNIWMYEYLSVCLSVCLSIYLSIYLIIYLCFLSPSPSSLPAQAVPGPEIEACTYGATSVVENP